MEGLTREGAPRDKKIIAKSHVHLRAHAGFSIKDNTTALWQKDVSKIFISPS